MNNILPVLNAEVLQEKANEFAMKGATESIKEFYSGYNSPYRKAIDEQLKSSEINGSIQLPNIISLINESLSKEIDAIANNAVAKTFVPLVQRFLTREAKEIKFSEVLKTFVTETDGKDEEDYYIEMDKDEKFGWYNIKITGNGKEYKLTMHEDYDTRKEEVKKYNFLSLPYETSSYDRRSKDTMKLSIDGTTLELPFTRDVLSDPFVSYIARLVIAGSSITLDTKDFDESMFPERCHCD